MTRTIPPLRCRIHCGVCLRTIFLFHRHLSTKIRGQRKGNRGSVVKVCKAGWRLLLQTSRRAVRLGFPGSRPRHLWALARLYASATRDRTCHGRPRQGFEGEQQGWYVAPSFIQENFFEFLRAQVVCQYFLKGTCKFGNACRNEHPRDGRTAGAFGSQSFVL